MKTRLFALALVVALTLGAGLTAFAQEVYDIAVIVKATDSDFWQQMLIGSNTADKQFDNLRIRTYGPVSEADIQGQVAILENVITSRPDAIVIASTSSDATVPALERAFDMGIKIVLVDNLVHTESYNTFLATDNVVGGGMAAEQFVERLKQMGKPLEGKVGLISAMAGVQVLTNRDNGFTTRLAEIAPGLEILPVRYVDNDIPTALAAAEDIITSTPDLVGFFADNNLGDDLVLIAFDSDPEEVNALQEGHIYALVVQDPFGMGYYGVLRAVDALEGKELPRYIDTGVVVVTRDNFNDDSVQHLLYPEQRAAAILGE
jgi:ribose transport system substrate-binding protein